MCRLGHHICGSCYRDLKLPPGCERQNGKGSTVVSPDKSSSTESFCVQCGAELTDTRNIAAEQIVSMMLRRSNMCLRPVNSDPSPPVSARTRDSDWADEESPQVYELHNACASLSKQTILSDSESVVTTTHRPFKCPKSPCSKTVGVAALTSHFSYEHPEVAMLSVEPGVTSHLYVSTTAIPLQTSRCISLLLVTMGKERDQQNTSRQVPTQLAASKLKHHFPVPLMATRMKTSEELSVEGHDYIVMIWLANAEPDTLYCTLEATNVTYNTRSLIYSGPIGSLRESQIPKDVYGRGDCLIINPGLLIQLSPEGRFDLNVIVH
ncbi:hypothetical protein L9F63_018465 [Diploptera punctata]|uniref:DUF4729 domain-containing protein n=1 Tax=Diploptera punctata TaxID=6984 RepID=A0AAD8EFG5_DIPPU|nr:hypothetical protein L9F63_018465 [Diploptera punctata]